MKSAGKLKVAASTRQIRMRSPLLSVMTVERTPVGAVAGVKSSVVGDTENGTTPVPLRIPVDVPPNALWLMVSVRPLKVATLCGWNRTVIEQLPPPAATLTQLLAVIA